MQNSTNPPTYNLPQFPGKPEIPRPRRSLNHTRSRGNDLLHCRLWQARLQCRITQENLAGMTGIQRRTIHAIETGKSSPSLYVALKIAKVLQLPVEEIFALRDLYPSPKLKPKPSLNVVKTSGS